MTLRLPQSLWAGFADAAGVSALNREVLEETAASLGRAGRMLQERLSALADARGDPGRDRLLQPAAEAAYALMVQRELCGLSNHEAVIADYGISSAVVARIGAL